MDRKRIGGFKIYKKYIQEDRDRLQKEYSRAYRQLEDLARADMAEAGITENYIVPHQFWNGSTTQTTKEFRWWQYVEDRIQVAATEEAKKRLTPIKVQSKGGNK